MATQDSTGSSLGPEFTQQVIDSMGPNTPPRLREIMSSFIRHMHGFARDVQLTSDEWLLGVNMINWAGQMSNEKRNEGQLMCDVIGLESLVDDITYTVATKSTSGLTASAILGPFYREDHPIRENGTTISFDMPKDAQVAYMHGVVTDAKTGKPLANAEIDIWQASTNGKAGGSLRTIRWREPTKTDWRIGLYEQQDPNQQDLNLRGKFITDSEGRYSLYCLRPTPYPIPEDGPAGKMLRMMDRHFYRPAHIHLLVRCKGYKQLITQIFDKDCKYLSNDTVFAVKDELTVEFKPRKDDPQASFDLEYNISLGGA
ncbi:Catechol 1,2-dioxygenase-like protein [Hapsidospora chrysogenum ATCC 11550]|uniref:Catechol 1,2-dioxygenase-like protein n=1 Tax=Hapsidospora chrysogenum (strain ATCC 11550 / CBS 779.69 / DSM 880 / IAM 14645 / JCM 23072 / IMI 49137) TaxID=857340 RepID=A0A086T400_HAPC1|nr:Catechol 1,2-dioxygenase-like protein [Hapsidospora chrysogenum ATCC 11550]